MLLNEEKLYGFLIYKKLLESEIIDYSGIDPTGLYRTLKKMEGSGVLSAEWEGEENAQPKKVYSITAEGKECLRNWESTLNSYKTDIEKLAKAVSESLGE